MATEESARISSIERERKRRADKTTRAAITQRVDPERAVMEPLGDRVYVAVSEPRCHSCQSSYRSQIDMMLLQGLSPAAVERALPPGSNVSRQSIGSHARGGHLPGVRELERKIIEFHAQQQGLSYDDEMGTLIDHWAGARLILQHSMSDMMEGRIHPSVSDALKCIELLANLEQFAGENQTINSNIEGVRRFFDIARDTLPGDVFSRFGQALRDDPIVRGLMGKKLEGEAAAPSSSPQPQLPMALPSAGQGAS